ncbi:hypothetical protein [Lyngbya aestuarii]|uniref:hypothetical protein n=1 Tax=Lyngbya aestuarii TaxID=118322 RepID=UPI00403E15D4
MQAKSTNLRANFQTYVEAQLPRVLTQLDRDPDSPTFGCFDRNYWHYKIRDFPSSILQQGVFTLEAIRQQNITDITPTTVIENWCVAAVNALARQIDHRGRVDEYYPFEASYPAAAFSLYAVCQILFEWQSSAPQLIKSVNLAPLKLLANQVASRTERQATNQQAAGLAGLALATKLGLLPESSSSIETHATGLFNSQHPEGWFNEYGGPDFGYLTVTLDALVDYHQVTSDSRALVAIDQAVNFLAQLVGADHRLPSTLNSRNTDYVVPYGLVRTAARNPLAAWLVEKLFRDIEAPSHFLWSTDDRYHLHYIFASVVRSLPYLQEMQVSKAPSFKDAIWLEGCGFWIYWSPDKQWNAYVAARKGGLVRIHRQGGLPPIVEHGWRVNKATQVWTNNWWSTNWVVVKEKSTIRINGLCQKTQFHVANPYKHLLLRVLAFGLRERLISLLKRIMIFRPGSADGPSFERLVEINSKGVFIKDCIGAFPGAKVMPSPRQNLRHVASADSFSPEEYLPSLLGVQSQQLDSQVLVSIAWQVDKEDKGDGGDKGEKMVKNSTLHPD